MSQNAIVIVDAEDAPFREWVEAAAKRLGVSKQLAVKWAYELVANEIDRPRALTASDRNAIDRTLRAADFLAGGVSP